MFFNSKKRKEKKRLKFAQKQLEKAILNDDNEQIQDALNAGADPDKPNDNGVLPLTILFARENMEGAKILLNYGASLSADGSHGTPLHMLSQFSDQQIALDLLEASDADFDLNVVNSMNQTPLHMACLSENADLAKVFIELGADVNASDISGSKPILTAAYNGDLDLVQCMFDRGAELGVRNANGETVLMAAINSPKADPELVAWLLIQGVDVEDKNEDQETPMHLACKKETGEPGSTNFKELIIFYLLTKGANPNPDKDRNQMRPIDYVKDDEFILAQFLGNADAIYDDPKSMLTEIGIVALQMERLQTAEQFLVKAVQSDEENGRASYYLGVLLMEAGEEDSAMDFLVRSAKLGYEEAVTFMREMGLSMAD